MIVYPAIDLKAGKCVRLMQGDMNQATVYGDDPAAMAKSFERQGAEWLHVVDLDGAFAGDSVNIDSITQIVRAVGIPVQLGGGLRNMAQLDKAINVVGIARAILGTAALEDQAFLKEAVARYGTRIAVGIDAKDGMAAARGWARTSSVPATDLALLVRELGVKTVIYTDISKDGMLAGPNIAASEELIRATGLDVIVSGGVASVEHIKQAKLIGAAGVIVGKALYTGAVTLTDAIAAGGKTC